MLMRYLPFFTLILVLLSCHNDDDDFQDLRGEYLTKHSYWELKLYTLDSGVYILQEVLDTIEIEQDGGKLYVKQLLNNNFHSSLNQPFIAVPDISPAINADFAFVPEDQKTTSSTKVNLRFFENGDSIYLFQFYDYHPFPIDREFKWEGRKMR